MRSDSLGFAAYPPRMRYVLYLYICFFPSHLLSSSFFPLYETLFRGDVSQQDLLPPPRCDSYLARYRENNSAPLDENFPDRFASKGTFRRLSPRAPRPHAPPPSPFIFSLTRVSLGGNTVVILAWATTTAAHERKLAWELSSGGLRSLESLREHTRRVGRSGNGFVADEKVSGKQRSREYDASTGRKHCFTS